MTVKLDWSKITPEIDPQHGMPCERSSHGLSMVQKGKCMILYGGEQIARTPLEPSQAAWAADANDGAWTWRRIVSHHDTNGPPARIAHAQTVYDDSVVYVFGGRAGVTMGERAMNDLWKLDCSRGPGTETWSMVTPDLVNGDAPPEERSFHKILCVGSNLYVFGGCSANGRLSDIHMFDIIANTWTNIGASTLLKGRGGPNFMTFSSETMNESQTQDFDEAKIPQYVPTMLGVIAGFSGEESNDGHLFNLSSAAWEGAGMANQLEGLRPRSVCVSASFPSTGVSVIFGGEVDPSQKGHEGAGGFENDIVLLDESTAQYLTSIPASSGQWPETRGWSAGASMDDGNGIGKLFIFGGLSGDDANPKRLNDLWCLDITKS
mmetsp:Transcript_22258/g.26430  ORF Transcript_22258/g.26430 Transcript_22258/m.26430 type:complete len:377 (+) Transcript_22258:130-1260(+)